MPYTYSMLNKYLNKNATKDKAKRMTLCHSLAGNKIEYLHITSKPVEKKTKIVEEPASAQVPDLAGQPSPMPNIKKQKSLTKKDKDKKKFGLTPPAEK
jgi:hypothetical protein